MRVVLRTLCACLVLALGLGALSPASAKGTKPGAGARRVLVLPLQGPITPVTEEALRAALDRAEALDYAALVIELDTPGGLESSMRTMVQHMLASRVPVIVWVAPSGARAASAGVLITIAADVAAMSPGTNIGAATPINLQGPMDSTLARKATNDASAFARTVAAQRGRNVAWAEDAVRHAVAIEEVEAVKIHVVDFVAGTLEEVLAKADGRTWTRGHETRTLSVAGLPQDRLEPGFRQRLLTMIADPNVAYLLMLLGFYGLMFELQNPGAILPGVVGGICLILAFLALSVLPVNYAGLALIVLALVFFLAEVKVQSHGILAAGGVLALVLGSLILFHGNSGVRVSLGVIASATLVTAAFFLVVVSAGLRAQRQRVSTGSSGLIGQRAQVVERLAPDGRVRLGGEYWNAVSSQPLEVGKDVEVIGVDGLRLTVRPWAKEA